MIDGPNSFTFTAGYKNEEFLVVLGRLEGHVSNRWSILGVAYGQGGHSAGREDREWWLQEGVGLYRWRISERAKHHFN